MMLIVTTVVLGLAILTFLGILISALKPLAIVGDVMIVLIMTYVLIRVRRKMNTKEKENLVARLSDLEKKIESVTKK